LPLGRRCLRLRQAACRQIPGDYQPGHQTTKTQCGRITPATRPGPVRPDTVNTTTKHPLNYLLPDADSGLRRTATLTSQRNRRPSRAREGLPVLLYYRPAVSAGNISPRHDAADRTDRFSVDGWVHSSW
jgi:hypothetical protein